MADIFTEFIKDTMHTQEIPPKKIPSKNKEEKIHFDTQNKLENIKNKT